MKWGKRKWERYIIYLRMEITNRLKELVKPKAEKIYLKFLKLDHFPKTPEELPDVVDLPVEALGKMEDAIFLSHEDYLERDEIIDYDVEKQEFVSSGWPKKLDAMRTSGSSEIKNLLRHALSPLTRKKGFLRYHTHPAWNLPNNDRMDIPIPSNEDIAIMKAIPGLAFIHSVISRKGVIALFQTEKSAKFPFVDPIVTYHLTRMNLDKIMKEGFRGFLGEYAKVFADLGFGLYYWSPPNEDIEKGDLANGIQFKKAKIEDKFHFGNT